LLPKNFPGMIDGNLNRTAINAQDILNALSDRNPFVIVFLLDCCREYHLRNLDMDRGGPNTSDRKSTGLKPMQKAGSIIAFACDAETTAKEDREQRNGLFTKHLLKHITTPNEDIDMILRNVQKGATQESNTDQIPFVYNGLLEKNIYLCDQPQGE
jgi:hypothetical protein